MASIMDIVEGTLDTIERIQRSGASRGGRATPASGPRTSGRRPDRRPGYRADAGTGTGGTGTGSTVPEIHREHRPAFSIVDAIDADTGRQVYVVRGPTGDTATCHSSAFARRVQEALNRHG